MVGMNRNKTRVTKSKKSKKIMVLQEGKELGRNLSLQSLKAHAKDPKGLD